MKKIINLFVSLLLVLSLFGCSNDKYGLNGEYAQSYMAVYYGEDLLKDEHEKITNDLLIENKDITLTYEDVVYTGKIDSEESSGSYSVSWGEGAPDFGTEIFTMEGITYLRTSLLDEIDCLTLVVYFEYESVECSLKCNYLALSIDE